MRMRELEKASGVSRETIRYYIREGLLPEPDRRHRNSATYNENHLALLLAIRRLRDERFLPLSVIRSLLHGEEESWPNPEILPEIGHLLRARLDSEGEWTTASQFLQETGADPEDFAAAARDGVIQPDSNGRISPRDQRILRLLQDIRKIGFTRERGYPEISMGRLKAVMHTLAEREIRGFFANVAPHVGELEAADMAERGIGLINQLMAEFFTSAVLALLSERRQRVCNGEASAPRSKVRDTAATLHHNSIKQP
ncbi:MAG: MerR family transcriptional regulator [Paracoccaceae bacterium]